MAAYEACGGNVQQAAERLRGKYPNQTYGAIRARYRTLGMKGMGVGGTPTIRPPDEVLHALHAKHGGFFKGIAEELGVSPGAVSVWMGQMGLVSSKTGATRFNSAYPKELKVSLENGSAVIFSDAHFWEDTKTKAHEALLTVIKKVKPEVVIANGDVLDGARVSRHDPTGLSETPTLAEEIEVCQRHLAEIARLAKGARKLFTWGNHDARPAKYLLKNAPELDGVTATVPDHFMGWEFCWRIRINDELLVMHRFRGGQHATFQNVLRAGMSIITGHLHSQRVYPFTDAKGTRYGVDLGCLADPEGPQFTYTEAAPLDWRSGFAVAEFRNGKLLPPQLVTVLDDGSVCWQRNEVL